MENPTLFDDAGAVARDEGIQRAYVHAEPVFVDEAHDVGVDIARRRQYLTAEDIVTALTARGITTHENRAMGGVMKRLQKEGHIEPTDRFTPATKVVAHKGPKRVWRSLTFPTTVPY